MSAWKGRVPYHTEAARTVDPLTQAGVPSLGVAQDAPHPRFRFYYRPAILSVQLIPIPVEE